MRFPKSNLLPGSGFLCGFDKSLSLVISVGPSIPCEYYFDTYFSVWLESGKRVKLCWNNLEQGELLKLNKAISVIVHSYTWWALKALTTATYVIMAMYFTYDNEKENLCPSSCCFKAVNLPGALDSVLKLVSLTASFWLRSLYVTLGI